MGGPIKVMFTSETAGTKHLRFVVGCFEPGQGLDMHIHPESEEVYYVIEGQGSVYLGKEKATTKVDRNTAIYIPSGTIHGIRNTSDGKLIVAFTIAPGKEPSQKVTV
jgi:oxalate decarboxylase/phosphoglucose isomerase-like protein (cupin superfamily)